MKRKHVLAVVAAVLFLGAVAPGVSAQTPQLKVKHLGPCRDQWINYAYMERLGRNPVGAKNATASNASSDFGECNCNLYAGCAWNSYSELENGVVAWDGYTKQARALVQPLGDVFQVLLNSKPAKVLIRNKAGRVFDFMGNPQSGYSLLSSNAKNLGGGTTVEFK